MTRTLSTKTRRQLTGFTGDTVSVVESYDAKNNVTTTTRDIVAANSLVTETVAYPDATNDTDTFSRAGLVQKVTTRGGYDVDFLYDKLGRRTDVEHPRSGGYTVTAYDSAGRVSSVTDPASNVTTYAYDPDNGRLSTVTNADTKKTYYEYDARGQVTNVWGHVPQPVEIGYDAYGQRTIRPPPRNMRATA